MLSLVGRAFKTHYANPDIIAFKSVEVKDATLPDDSLLEDRFKVEAYVISEKIEDSKFDQDFTKGNLCASVIPIIEILDGKYEEVDYFDAVSKYLNDRTDYLGEKITDAEVAYENSRNDKFYFYQDNIHLVVEKYRKQIEGRCFYWKDKKNGEYVLTKYESIEVRYTKTKSFLSDKIKETPYVFIKIHDKFFDDNLTFVIDDVFEEQQSAWHIMILPSIIGHDLKDSNLIETTLDNFNNNIPCELWKQKQS